MLLPWTLLWRHQLLCIHFCICRWWSYHWRRLKAEIFGLNTTLTPARRYLFFHLYYLVWEAFLYILLSTSVHYKPTDSHSYLHYSSHHPQKCKDGIFSILETKTSLRRRTLQQRVWKWSNFSVIEDIQKRPWKWRVKDVLQFLAQRLSPGERRWFR